MPVKVAMLLQPVMICQTQQRDISGSSGALVFEDLVPTWISTFSAMDQRAHDDQSGATWKSVTSNGTSDGLMAAWQGGEATGRAQPVSAEPSFQSVVAAHLTGMTLLKLPTA